MIVPRPSEERGVSRFGWLDSRHSFSFGEYLDPAHRGFRCLRVINEDRVAPGAGFDTHGHRDMEILSYVLEGELAHRDSLGNGSAIRPGELQRMSAGTGILHSEHNGSATAPAHFLQIWLFPEQTGLAPSYEQRAFDLESRAGGLRLIGSRDGRDGSVTIHQDVDLLAGRLEPGQLVKHRSPPGRHQWLQVVRGVVIVNGLPLKAGDGAAASEEDVLHLEARDRAEVLLFDLA